jgi:aminoglycoside phosphotransferase family enzyme
MTKEQINKLLFNGKFPEDSIQRELIETHISWVLVCDQFVYKIKKPVHYSFLDFSTLEQRKHYCQREIDLNRRLTDKVYMYVQPVVEYQDTFQIGNPGGKSLIMQ